MWIFLSDAFLSIVKPPGAAGRKNLLVRARVKGDIERVFPGAEVTMTPDRDYRFRALVPLEQVAEALAQAARDIAYGNFKSSVKEHDRHVAYMGVWSEMHRLQVQRARKGAAKRAADDEFPWVG